VRKNYFENTVQSRADKMIIIVLANLKRWVIRAETKNLMEKLKNYILDSIDEIRNKVSWSKFNELQSSAILVLVASVIFALVIGLIDFGFNNALHWFYREF